MNITSLIEKTKLIYQDTVMINVHFILQQEVIERTTTLTRI